MNRSRHWRSRLTGTMLGQLQLATYAAVLLGFTGATSTGLLLSERSRLRVGEAELLTASAALAFQLESQGDQGETLIVQELQNHSSLRTNLWLEQPDGQLITPRRDHRPIPAALLQAAATANPQREQGQSNLIVLQEREYLTLLDRRLRSGDLLWSSTEISGLGPAQSEFLAWMILIWGSALSGSLLLVSLLVKRITRPLQELSSRSAELTAEGLQTAALPVPRGPQELSQLTRTYNALTERLAQSWSQQRQFVSAVSHELQAPLTLVSGSLKRVIRKAPQLEAQLVQRLHDAEEETIGMQQLLNDLLDLSRSDSGRLQVKQEPVDLRPLLEEVVRAQGSALARELTLELPAEGSSSMALGDAARLRQVLLNLIENAHKYSPAEQPIQLRLRSGINNLTLEVEDRGIGIPLQDQAYVFDRFHRGANTTGQSGSGVGLSVVKLLLEAMGGSIKVRSEPGMGSCFRIQLRRAP
ncbi:two-component system sensor histidine kinase [Synechococcus sp. BIOS-E4-1]|uniref:sensor histidine kinase n=1 Tax=Synechococcus sp. BIOS-E4-1 TaxID=1400864 RepID=UPI001645528E|nr:HAMP domain-containing sensor histidine kinase [Synechococcus sp. BIOS-E4-1]QNI53322.1 two-component system sensor histidine kinase [Synechococcus sp. BIOS-E4-1]